MFVLDHLKAEASPPALKQGAPTVEQGSLFERGALFDGFSCIFYPPPNLMLRSLRTKSTSMPLGPRGSSSPDVEVDE